jgi:hypothetical protein
LIDWLSGRHNNNNLKQGQHGDGDISKVGGVVEAKEKSAQDGEDVHHQQEQH